MKIISEQKLKHLLLCATVWQKNNPAPMDSGFAAYEEWEAKREEFFDKLCDEASKGD